MSEARRELLLAPPLVEQTCSRREGLYSLFRRTCERNQLVVNDVVAEMLRPLTGPNATRVRKMVKPLHLMNYGGGLSQRFIARMHEIGVAQKWLEATVAELDVRGVAELRVMPYRRWCPECYHEDCSTAHGPYDRLLWSIELVATCPIHSVRLENACAECGAAKMPVLMGVDISGFCPHCRSFLGMTSSRLDAVRDDHSRYLIWVAQSFADLLDSPLPWDHDAAEPIKSMIRKISDFHFGGAYAHLARSVSRNKSLVCSWLSGAAAPGWLALCELSYGFQIPLRSLLLGDASAVALSTVRPLPFAVTQLRSHPRKRPEIRDNDQLRLFLKEVEDGRHLGILTMVALAARLNIDGSDLRRRVPKECRRLSAILRERRTTSVEWRLAARAREFEDAIRRVGQDLAREDAAVTRRNVDLRLACLGFGVRHAESKSVRERVAKAKSAATFHASGT